MNRSAAKRTQGRKRNRLDKRSLASSTASISPSMSTSPLTYAWPSENSSWGVCWRVPRLNRTRKRGLSALSRITCPEVVSISPGILESPISRSNQLAIPVVDNAEEAAVEQIANGGKSWSFCGSADMEAHNTMFNKAVLERFIQRLD